MHRTTFFDVTPADLGRLDPRAAVDLFRQLLWAEVRRCGIADARIDVPSAITAKDGGVDAELSIPESPNSGQIQSALIRPGLTGYQIKTGRFSAKNDTEIKALVSGKTGIKHEGEVVPGQ